MYVLSVMKMIYCSCWFIEVPSICIQNTISMIQLLQAYILSTATEFISTCTRHAFPPPFTP